MGGSTLMKMRLEKKYSMVCVFMVFNLLSAVTVMNMLIGVLCEVVTAVGEAEKENAAIALVKQTVLLMLKGLDDDQDGKISRLELRRMCHDAEAKRVFEDLQVNMEYFLGKMNMFYIEPDQQLEITFIMHMILDLRGDRQMTVKDIVNATDYDRFVLDKHIDRLEN